MKDILVFMGSPGSGKGTQAKMLADLRGWDYISTGDLFRLMLKDPKTPKEDIRILEELKQGKLLPDEFIFKATFAGIKKSVSEGRGIALDGAIRTINQAKGFYEFFNNSGLIDRVLVVLIDITDEEAKNRLTQRRVCKVCSYPVMGNIKSSDSCPKCGGGLETRVDDNPSAIDGRLKIQGRAATEPLFEFFKSKNLAKRVDGIGTIEEVLQRVLNAIQ